MNTVFSARLSALRQERGLTQKEAAAKLGISAALLSHYEKGIRECGLAFLGRAASFYEVSCDDLLGLGGDGFASKEDGEIRDITPEQKQQISTLLRAVAMLHDRLSADVLTQDILLDYFTLSVYRVIVKAVEAGVLAGVESAFSPSAAEALSAAVLDTLVKTRLCASKEDTRQTADAPFSMQAIVTHAENLLQKEFAAMLRSDLQEP